MAVLKVPYTDINATMRGIRTQVIDSTKFCQEEMPSFRSPKRMFNSLRNMVTYKNDPKGIELLQSVPTLFKDNYWNIPGAGDCDCFTILTLAMCQVQGWDDQCIVLAGRSKLAPVHIWSRVKYKGNWYSMDLTNALFDVERNYKFKQLLYL